MKNQDDKDHKSEFQETASEAFIKHFVDIKEEDAEFVILLKGTFGD